MKGPIVTLLSARDRASIEAHFLQLSAEDRRLRFGLSLPDDAVREYVSRVDFDEHAVFGVFDENMQLDAVAHLARKNESAELGISVVQAARGRGLGSALLARSHTHARNWGVEVLRMQCLTENAAMMRIALKQGMTIVRQSGEADAFLSLPPADATSRDEAAFDQCVAALDNARKVHQVQRSRAMELSAAA